MRIYDGSPRQDFEEVFRSIGAFLDARGMRDILMVEVSDGFVVQGLVSAGASTGAWSDTIGTVVKETLQFLDDDIAKFMEEAVARRGRGDAAAGPSHGVHERALRVVGRWMDEQKPRDVFLFEQDGAYVVRLHVAGQAGSHHILAEFTKDDINDLVRQGPSLRVAGRPGAGTPAAAGAAAGTAGAAQPAPAQPAPAQPVAAPPVAAAPGDVQPPGPPPTDNPGWGSPTG
ncbi:MAG TPA: hypothetical protein VFL03_11605 [Candidatus Limnocylindrales bacterium]|nr:hypothetical protein [Candidatus Limnocylindrales bacterium]